MRSQVYPYTKNSTRFLFRDCISVRGVLAPLLFSDRLLGDFWSRERFLNAFVAAAYAVGALAAANVVCAASRIMRGKITAEEE